MIQPAMFYLFANVTFVLSHHDDWQAAYDDLAAYVEPNEPSTKTYYCGIPLDYAHEIEKTTSMLAFDVYGTREDLYETHLSSQAMAKFLETIPPHTTTDLDLNHYRCLGGFLDRDGDRKECDIMLDQKILCKSFESWHAVSAAPKSLVDTVSQTEGKKPAGVLTFMAFECLDDELVARLFGRLESREAMEMFLRREDVNGFWQSVKSQVRGMEQGGYVPNGKGWLHRGGQAVEEGAKL